MADEKPSAHRMETTDTADLVVIQAPMCFTLRDVRQADWPQCRESLLDAIRACYADLLDREIRNRGWLDV